jgi:hypothetical protein
MLKYTNKVESLVEMEKMKYYKLTQNLNRSAATG